MSATIPPDNRAIGSAGHVADHNNIADMLTQLQAQVQAGGLPLPTGTAAAGTVPVSKGPGQPTAWKLPTGDIWVTLDYGAAGDARTMGDGSMTAGSAVLTSASANFTSADVGKSAGVLGAGTLPSPPQPAGSTGSGTLGAGTYQAVLTYATSGGESTPSASVSFTVGAGSSITIFSPPPERDAASYYVYFTQAGGSVFTRQQTPGSPTAIGTPFTLSAAPSGTGVTPPFSSNAQCALRTTILSVTNSTTAVLAVSAAYNVAFATVSLGTDNTSAFNQALAAAAASGSRVMVPPGTYLTNGPLVYPSLVTMLGTHGQSISGSAGGTVIQPSCAWGGGWAVIALQAGQEYELGDFTIDCTNLVSSAIIDGINFNGQCIAGHAHDVKVNNAPRSGFTINPGNGNGYTWTLRRFSVNGTTSGPGINLAGMTDTDAIDCYVINAQIGWYIYGNSNCLFEGCRGEWCGQYGFQIDGNQGYGMRFVGCSTDRNGWHGVYISATGDSHPIVISGGCFRRDGKLSTNSGYAGIAIASGATNRIIIDGVAIPTGTNDDGSGNATPQYGVSVQGPCTYVALTNVYASGITAGTNGVTPANGCHTRLVYTELGNAVTGAPSGTLTYLNDTESSNYRGQVQYSTTYNTGDVILYNGERIYITGTVTTGAGTNGLGQPFISGTKYVALSSLGIFYAYDYGVSADGSTDNWAALQNLLILVRSLTSNSFAGYRIILPAGTIALSKTLIIPTSTMIEGQGLYSTTLKLLANANCDVVQTEQFNSSAQAALLTTLQSSLTAGNLRNAFRWGIRNLTIHGAASIQTPGTYHMGLNVQTNPLTTTGTGDPDFDPAGIVENVQFRNATGDGFFHNGRSALRLTDCIAWFNQGNGFSPSFDTQINGCQAGFNAIAGFYFNHGSDQGAGNKSYNNGNILQWASGGNYSVGQRVMSGGLPYDAINALTNDTVVPSSDPANWAAVTATSPAAWGCGVYMDANSGEITFNCDNQQNSAHSWYFHNCTLSGSYVSGVSTQPNFNQSGSLNSTNPNNYAHVCVDGSNGMQAAIACGDGSGHTATQFRLRIINASTRNDITLTGDTNATFLTPDSIALVGSGNSVRYNGVNYTSTLAAENDVAIASPGNGQVLTFNGSKWVSQAPPSGFYANVFGNGSGGNVVLDGTTAYPGFTLAGGNYSLNSAYLNSPASNLTVNAGVTLTAGGIPLQVAGTVTNNGTISQNGGSANGASAGGGTSGPVYGGQAGRAGGTGVGTAGFNQTNAFAAGQGGTGGSGTSGAGGVGGTVGSTNSTYVFSNPWGAITGAIANFGGLYAPVAGSGGGSGAGDGTNSGGGSGAGGGMLVIAAHSIVNNGVISANGGNGGIPPAGNCGGGGGGGGGTVVIYELSAVTGTGTITASAGTGGSGTGTGTAGANGGAGQVIQRTIS